MLLLNCPMVNGVRLKSSSEPTKSTPLRLTYWRSKSRFRKIQRELHPRFSVCCSVCQMPPISDQMGCLLCRLLLLNPNADLAKLFSAMIL